MPQPLCDQLGTFAIVASVQDAHLLGIGAQVNAGRPHLDFRVSVRTSCEVPGRAIGGLNLDFPRPLQLGRVRMPRPFSLPVVEDAGRGFPLLRRFAPVSRGQGAILLPRAAAHIQRPVTVSRDPQEAHRRRLPVAPLRQGELPPQAFDAGDPALRLDRLPKLLIDGSHFGSGPRGLVPYAGKTQKVARKLCAACVKNERSAHSEDAAEQTGLEDHVVSRRSLAGFLGI